MLNQVAEFQGSFLPPVAFVNHEVLHNFIKHKEREFNLQCNIFDKKINAYKEDLDLLL